MLRFATKLKRLVPLLLIPACVTTMVNKRARGLDTSDLASVMIGPFQGDWQVLDLKLARQDVPGDIRKAYPKSMFGEDGLSDVIVSIPQGRYTIDLSYLNVKGELVFRSCPDELTKNHEIKTAKYKTTIDICPVNSTKPVGNVPINSTAEVSITPRPILPGDAGKSPAGPKPGPAPSGSKATLSGDFWVDPNSQAAADAKSLYASKDPRARAIDYIAQQPAGVWYGAWSGDIGQAVSKHVSQSKSANAYAVMILYNIPYRDCGQHSAGGLSASAYGKWIENAAKAIGDAPAIVIVEPDAVTLNDCLSPELKEERFALLRNAVDKFAALPKTKVYIDAGHSAWLSVDEVSNRLKKVGIEKADGFALNVSNYQTTESNIEYGRQVASRVGGKNFVIDTSRNGNGPMGSVWCNPRGRALGKLPTFKTGATGVDAFLWLKRPGESDGSCENGNPSSSAPSAGQWWRDIALELAQNAGIK
jgi:endoglucanase